MKRHVVFLISALVVVLDQLTKHLVRTMMSPLETINVLPFFHIVNIRNEGAAFGMLRSFGNTAFVVISVIAIAFIFYLILKSNEDKLSLSLILGGAAGNLIDRIIFGNVTDFIDVFAGRHHWPAFNVADSALTIGLALILFKSLMSLRKGEKADVSNIN